MSSEDPLVLVTGVTGFIASWVAYTALKAGYRVRGTVRDLRRQEKFVHLAKDFCPRAVGAKHSIKLIQADLLKAEEWAEAVQGCTYVLHVASPFPIVEPKDKVDLLAPAIDGTLNVIKACAKCSTVKRLVITSSTAAIAYGRNVDGTEFTEEMWTDLTSPMYSVGAYVESKTMAEQAAWSYMKSGLPSDCKMDMCTINPTLVLGNLFSKNPCSSEDIIRQILMGEMIALPDITLDCVAVEDVARAHLLAMVTPEAGGKRFMVHGGQISLQEIGSLLAKEFKHKGFHPTTWRAPKWLINLLARFDPQAKSIAPMIGIKRNLKPQNCADILNMSLSENVQQTVLETAYGIIRTGIVQDRSKLLKDRSRHLDPQKLDRPPGTDLDVSDVLALRAKYQC